MPSVQQRETEKMGTVYEVENDSGVKLVTSPEGARLLDWIVPIDGGRDLVVGYDTIAGHQKARYYGATIGPVAGRIAGTRFTIDGKSIKQKIMIMAIHCMADLRDWIPILGKLKHLKQKPQLA